MYVYIEDYFVTARQTKVLVVTRGVGVGEVDKGKGVRYMMMKEI